MKTDSLESLKQKLKDDFANGLYVEKMWAAKNRYSLKINLDELADVLSTQITEKSIEDAASKKTLLRTCYAAAVLIATKNVALFFNNLKSRMDEMEPIFLEAAKNIGAPPAKTE